MPRALHPAVVEGIHATDVGRSSATGAGGNVFAAAAHLLPPAARKRSNSVPLPARRGPRSPTPACPRLTLRRIIQHVAAWEGMRTRLLAGSVGSLQCGFAQLGQVAHFPRHGGEGPKSRRSQA